MSNYTKLVDIKLENIPDYLKSQKHWITWSGKKIPCQKWQSNPDSRMLCQDAMQAAKISGHLGIGFVFAEDAGLIGLDMDHCATAGKINPIAKGIIEFFNSYTEFSVSGTGVHIIIKADVNPNNNKGYLVQNLVNKQVEAYDPKNPAHDKPEYYAKQCYEIYPRGRYFTFTGNVVGTKKEVEDRSEQVKKFIDKFQPQKEQPVVDDSKQTAMLSSSTSEGEVDQLRGALLAIPSDDYEIWFKVGRALKETGSEIGDDVAKALYSEWSAKSSNFCQAELDKKWDEPSNGKITKKSIYFNANERGWDKMAVRKDGSKYRAERSLPEIYWDTSSCNYIRQIADGSWIKENESQVKSILCDKYHISRVADGSIPDTERMVNRIRDMHNVAYAGPLAGWCSGMANIGNKKVLITNSPPTIDADEAFGMEIVPPTTILTIIKKMFDNDHDQVETFLAWLKVSRECLENHIVRNAQMLIICGPRDCGKSWLQKKIITAVVGGRSTDPYQYMCGDTPFNYDLISSEHLMMMDVAARTDIASRRKFGDNIKSLVASGSQRAHAKGKDAVELIPIWRCSLSLNDEPEHLALLPPIDDSLEDKLILLRAVGGAMPNTTKSKDWLAFDKQIDSEMRGFIEFLKVWQIPERLLGSRYAIKPYCHSHYRAALDDLAPEAHLKELIERHMVSFGLKEWTATASEIREDLCKDTVTSYDARNLLGWVNSCGTYLGRLAKRFPENVHRVSRDTADRRWFISFENEGADKKTVSADAVVDKADIVANEWLSTDL